MANLMELKKHLTQRRETLRNKEQKFEPQWRELREYVNPFHGRFSDEKPDDYRPSFTKIIDSTPMTSLRMLSAGMQSGLTSPSRQWFKLSVHDYDLASDQEVQEWCDDVQRRMMTVMASSGFYRALHSLYEEVSMFGTSAMVILPSYEHVIECQTLTAGSFYLGRAESNKIDTIYRDMWMTAGEMEAEFGAENLSEGVRSALQNNRDQLFKVCHAVEPDSMHVSRHPFVSVYWEPTGDTDKFLRIGGYRTFPVMCPRWNSLESDTYGYGPASEALPDIKTLVALKTDLLTGIKKQVNPPLVASRDVLSGGVKTMPGGITYTAGAVGPMVTELYKVNIDLNSLASSVEQYKNDVRRAFYVDLFMMLSEQSGQMTAREVSERHEEKMLALGPVLESLEWELLIPAIERIYAIMDEMRLIPEIPEVMNGQEVKIEFVSVLAQAQRMMGLSAVEQSLAFAGNIAQFDNSLLDVLDTENTLRQYVSMVGAPANILRSTDEVMEIRQQRAQEQQAMAEAQQQQAALQGINSASDSAKKLSEVPVGGSGGSALDAVMGMLDNNNGGAYDALMSEASPEDGDAQQALLGGIA